MADAGYDVADYRDIDPLFGTLRDADALIAEAHALGIRVIVDLVPNHTSDEHAWFQAALAAAPGSPERERYIFRDGKGPDGDEPPNDWRSVFGGRAWTRVTEPDGTPGQWYLHLFDPKQPDLNWENPEVREEFLDILRFWLDRGVDGFRVDVAHGLVKEEGLPDWQPRSRRCSRARTPTASGRRCGTRTACTRSTAPGARCSTPTRDRMMVAEAWVEPASRLARYLRPDEMHQAFNFALPRLAVGGHRRARGRSRPRSRPTPRRRAHHLGALQPRRRAPRHPARPGRPGQAQPARHRPARPAARRGARPAPGPGGLRADARAARGRRTSTRARSSACPSTPPSPTSTARTRRGSATTARSPAGTAAGSRSRGSPTPRRTASTTTGESWLPQPESFAAYAVDRQAGVAGSTLELYRAALALRAEHQLGHGELALSDEYGDDVLALLRTTPTSTVLVVTNFGDEPVAVPHGAEVLLSSADLVDGQVPTDVTVWARLER